MEEYPYTMKFRVIIKTSEDRYTSIYRYVRKQLIDKYYINASFVDSTTMIFEIFTDHNDKTELGSICYDLIVIEEYLLSEHSTITQVIGLNDD